MDIRILIAGHNPKDCSAIAGQLAAGGSRCALQTVQSEREFADALATFNPHLIVSNAGGESFSGAATLKIRQQHSPQTPFIFLTDAITVDLAVKLIKLGADDLILKKDLNALRGRAEPLLRKSGNTGLIIPGEEKNQNSPFGLPDSLIEMAKVLDQAPDLMCCCDIKGTFIWVNRASKRILGYPRKELIGRNYTDFLFQERSSSAKLDASGTECALYRRPIEKRFRHKNGSIVYLLWSAVWDETNQLVYYTSKDITEKKNIEKAFAIERRRLLDLYAHAPACIAILKGPNHVYEMANALYLRLIDKTSIIGKTLKKVLPELANQGIFEVLDHVYATGESFSANEKLISLAPQQGKTVELYLNFIYQAHRDAENRIDGILVFATDVTEQVLSRKKIEEREIMYRDLISRLPVATYSCDSQGRITLYNRAAVALWGREPQIGCEPWNAFWSSSGNAVRPSEAKEKTTKGALGKELMGLAGELCITRPNGEQRSVVPHPVPFHDSQGQITGAVIVLSDITEMKAAQNDLQKSEIKYRHLFENNPMPMWIIDLKTLRFLDVNQMAIQQYGYSREEFLCMSAAEIRPQTEKKRFEASRSSALEKRGCSRGKWKHLKKDGTVMPVEIIAHDILYEGAPARLILSNDITERVKAQEDLEKRNRDLTKANTELDRFAYSVSHDLRSPLTSILGLLSFIETESREADTLKHAEMIRSSVNRLDDFIKNILRHSQNSRMGLETEKVPVSALALEVVESLQSMKGAKGICYEIEVKEQEPFYTDRFRFQTILENLISNAIKYHKPEKCGRFIRIEGHADGNFLHFTLTDNGIGIAPQYHKKIYEMFFRISSSTDGSGIGLYIVKDAIEMLQGTIAMESQQGIGTAFSIQLKNMKP